MIFIQRIIALTIGGLILILISSCHNNTQTRAIGSFNQDWKFYRADTNQFSIIQIAEVNDSFWEDISLPHTASLEPLVMKDQQWTGICWYKKSFFTSPENKGKHISILIEAAMNDATIWLNGIEIKRHFGGYLPIYLDISDRVSFDKGNTLLIRLDNRENPEIPPGKPLKELDFNYYSGIYRNAYFIVKEMLHFTEPMEIDSLQGGGIIVHVDSVSEETAILRISASVKNKDKIAHNFSIEGDLKDKHGTTVASVKSEKITISQNSDMRVTLILKVSKPYLWSPDTPNLYTFESRLIEGKNLIDIENTRIGIREIGITAKDGFTINGKKLKIRGTNRHQEYPYIGYALSDNAQFRDAWKIKQAGFNFVRSSHYPQSPAFLNACDELGILVMDAIPGWQFIGNSVFCERSYQNTREMCRRDRNHPSIIMWEASLNETEMPVEFMRKSHEIVHSELPFKNIYTCGWKDTIYDVFIPARQHSVPPDYWNMYSKDKPIFIAEYGSWEYYAQNAGFNQTEFKDLLPAERSSRQLRGYGEKHLLQQAYNFQEAYNSNLNGPAFGCSNWGMFDYNRGYASDIETSGILDITRIPKFTYWFYKSQSDYDPVCFIASYNTALSANYIRIFSNGDSVAVYRNGNLLSVQKPDNNPNTTNLPHPPFTFKAQTYIPGALKAESFKNGKLWAESIISTAGNAAKLKLEADFSGRGLKAEACDIVFIYAYVTDEKGNLLYNSTLPISFTSRGDAKLIGDNPAKAEAGIACIMLKAGNTPGKIILNAESPGLIPASIEIIAE